MTGLTVYLFTIYVHPKRKVLIGFTSVASVHDQKKCFRIFKWA